MNKKEQTDKLITESLLSLLEEQDFYKITVSNICKRANIRRSTFYNHYHDKYQILEEQITSICTQVDELLEAYFSLERFDTILSKLSSSLDKRTFLILIEIQSETIDLQKELRLVLEKRFREHLIKNNIAIKLNVSESFLEAVYSSIMLTFIVHSFKHGELNQNAIFLNELYASVLKSYGINMEDLNTPSDK